MLGTMVCQKLLRNNCEVVGFCLESDESSHLVKMGVKRVFGDIRNPASWEPHLASVDHVIHVAALTKMWPSRSDRMMEVNRNATLQLASKCYEAGVRDFVYVSSASVFEMGSISEPGNETTTTSTDFGLDYIKSKVEAQQRLLEMSNDVDMKIVVINPCFMIGPYDANLGSSKMIVELYKGTLPGYTKGGKNFVYTGDVAEAAVNAISLGENGECYIVGNRNMSYKEFFKLVHKVIGRDFRMLQLPTAAVLIYGAWNNFLARAFRRKLNLSYNMARVGVRTQYYSSEKAVKTLKHKQTPLDLAVKECIDYCFAIGAID